MGGQTDLQVDASSTQVVKKPFQCSLVCTHTEENNTEVNLQRLVLGG